MRGGAWVGPWGEGLKGVWSSPPALRSGWSVVRVSFVRPLSPREPCVPAARCSSQSVFPPSVGPPPLGWPGQDLSRSPLGGGGN